MFPLPISEDLGETTLVPSPYDLKNRGDNSCSLFLSLKNQGRQFIFPLSISEESGETICDESGETISEESGETISEESGETCSRESGDTTNVSTPITPFLVIKFNIDLRDVQ
jgi:hypothetical protein